MLTFTTLLKSAFRDRISLFWAIIFPLVLLLILGFTFTDTAYRKIIMLGSLGISVLFFGLSGIAFETLAQRHSGVYKLLRATPYNTGAFITSLTLSRTVVSLLSCLVLITVSVFVLDVSIHIEQILLLLPLLILGAICFTFMGITVSNFAQNETQVAMLNNILTLPMIFGSSTFYNLDIMPDWIKTVSTIFPLNYLIEGEHAVLAGDTSGILAALAIMLGFTILALIIAVVTFRWNEDISISMVIKRLRFVCWNT